MDKKVIDGIDHNVVEQVDTLNEEVKVLALNLAIYLARAKGRSDKLTKLEPEFIRLVNSTVKAVQELAQVINAARNLEPVPDAVNVGGVMKDPLEVRLKLILQQCAQVMHALGADEGVQSSTRRDDE